ncbi:MAG TPA: cation-translocating P-type ATPase [Candidatus Limnocylindria bacterium]|nr:cation-translocating P-type ATPase [Candidatus Limnocylindria bacterium]
MSAPGAVRADAGPASAWHVRAAADVARELDTDLEHGLAPSAVEERRRRYGPNVLAEVRRRGPVRMLLDQFADFMVLILIAAAVVAGCIGEPQDTAAIVGIVVLNAVLGFVQEYRAENAMAALNAMAAPHARVRRAGVLQTVEAAELVPGDVVLLDAGAAVPADLRLVEAAQLRTDESALTGESEPVDKGTDPIADADAALGDRRNMAYRGTLVTHGRGVGVAVATGMRTEVGRIAALLQHEVVPPTPLQQRLARLGKQLALAVLAISAVVFAVGLLRGEEPVLMLLTALSLAVAAIPEALPAVVTVSLALGARRMAREHALIRRLAAVETLGSVTYICTDKTGTLTLNRMRVVAYHVDGVLSERVPDDARDREPWATLLAAMALANDATLTSGEDGDGDPTEVALVAAAARAGVAKHVLEARMPRVAEVPFSSERACMSTVHDDGAGGAIVFTKGAPEQVVRGCTTRLGASGVVPLDGQETLATAGEMAARGLRVLAVAYRPLTAPWDAAPGALEREQRLLGLVGLLDPPRPEAKDAVARCHSAGIRVVMITGDHPTTARAVADMLDIVRPGDRVVSGRELAEWPPERLRREADAIRVYARVDPEQKIDIVSALQDRGEFVAMTGDGVNDAPALRRANIGVAMGRCGTDVAREAGSMVLLDDDFATIVRAVAEGRRIYDNLRKFVRYVLTGNSAELWTLLLGPLLQLPIPLLPIHILWVNLVTDGLPGLALAVEPAEENLMRRPPRPPDENFFAHGLWQHVVWVGMLMGGVTLATQAWALQTGSAHWQSMTFTVLTLAQMGHVLAIRAERDSLFRQGFWSNPLLFAAVGLTFLLQMATLYVPALQPIFKTQALSAGELLGCLAVSAVMVVGVELEKWAMRRGWLYAGGGLSGSSRRTTGSSSG